MKIDNKTARALWLTSHGLAQTPTGPLDTAALIERLGFVQLDTVQVISRAHHHILWSRNQNYREPMLDPLLRPKRQVFEHFTHDASVLPMTFLPLWQRQFQRKKAQVARSNWFGKHLDPQLIDEVTRRITEEGPLSTKSFDTKTRGKKEMWQRPPHKMVLDYLWYAGELATCHREGFTKFYDLGSRIFPQDVPQLSDQEQIDGLCRAALAARDAARLTPVEIQGADGSWTDALACPDIEARIAQLSAPTKRLRILNPFDPAIRDRSRLARLFGFDYTVEMFVPAAKRKWGYYVYPLLEGDQFIGRIEAKGDRNAGSLTLSRVWTETGQPLSEKRSAKLDAEIFGTA